MFNLRRSGGRSGASPAVSRSGDGPELALLARVAEGDIAAFESLYRLYHPRLARFIGRATWRPGVVEEVLNDTMHVVWSRAASFNGECKVSTWIFAIAYRTTLKALRDQDEPCCDSGIDLDTQADAAAGPEEQHMDRQRLRRLHHAIAALPDEQRCAVILTYFHDLPYSEIAAIVQCPVDTVKTRVFHGRRKLRALMDGPLEDWL